MRGETWKPNILEQLCSFAEDALRIQTSDYIKLAKECGAIRAHLDTAEILDDERAIIDDTMKLMEDTSIDIKLRRAMALEICKMLYLAEEWIYES